MRALSILCVLVLCGCAHGGHAAAADVRDLELYSTTDLHGHLEAGQVPGHHGRGVPRFTERGGLALLGGFLDNARAHYPGRVLLVDGGDLFQGTLASNLGEGAAMLRGMKQLGYAAAALGNHEFDYGPVGLASTPKSPADDPRGALHARMAEAGFPMLGANVVTDDGTAAFPAYQLIEVDGVPIGIVGGTSESLFQTTMRSNLVGLKVTPLAPALLRAAEEASAHGARVIIAVVHAGGECSRSPRDIASDQPGDLSGCKANDEVFALARALARATSKSRTHIAAIVAGHTHQAITAVVDGIPIIQAGKNGQHLSHVSVEVRGRGPMAEATGRFRIERTLDVCARVDSAERCLRTDEPGGRPPQYFGPVTPNAAVTAAIAADLEKAHIIAARSIGISLPEGLQASYSEESALGNFVASTVRDKAQADIGFVNGGGLRADLPPGELHYGQLYESFPFDNEVVAIEMTGAQLLRMVRNNLRSHFGALSYGGLHVKAHCSDGKLVAELSLESGAPVTADARYRVGTLDFLAHGGDGAVYDPPQLGAPRGVIRDVLEEALRAHGGTLRATDGLFDPAHRRVELSSRRPLRCRSAAGQEESGDEPAGLPPKP